MSGCCTMADNRKTSLQDITHYNRKIVVSA